MCALFAQAMSGIFEIDERDITDVQQALALKEIAITERVASTCQAQAKTLMPR